MRKRRVVLLGATGSIGESALCVARDLPERMEIVGMSAHTNVEKLAAAAQSVRPAAVCVTRSEDAVRLREMVPGGTRVLHGGEGLVELATMPEADMVLVAIVGTGGLRPALAALERGKDLAIASKEILVMAGEAVMQAAGRSGARILPVDSEHNAIFQCLEGRNPAEIKRLILTCSGGPFRETPAEEFARVTPDMALRHPIWRMGKKITIDSATLFNKGLEMLEAHWLFGVPMEKIDVVIHPQSIIHSMVEFVDGSVLAQLSPSDMRFPIQYAVTWPDRVPGTLPRLDFATLGRLEFFPPREGDFPALRLARQAGMAGGTLPAVFNAANEAAVEAFLEGRLTFPGIWKFVEKAMARHQNTRHPSLDKILAADAEGRQGI